MTSPREEAFLDNALALFVELVEEFEQETGSSINKQADGEVEEYLIECLNSHEPPEENALLRIMKKHIKE